MSTNPSEQPDSSTTLDQHAQTPIASSQSAELPQAGGESSPTASSSDAPIGESEESERPRRTVLIGSQRDPAAYRPKPKRDWVPVVTKKGPGARPQEKKEDRPAAKAAPRIETPAPKAPEQVLPAGPEPIVVVAMPDIMTVADTTSAPPAVAPVPPTPAAAPVAESPPAARTAPAVQAAPVKPIVSPPASSPPAVEREPEAEERDQKSRPSERRRRGRREREDRAPRVFLEDTRSKIAPPSIRGELSPELEEEYQAALANVAIDQLIVGAESVTTQAVIERETRLTGRVVATRRDEVFVELGGREQGVLPVRNLPAPPEPGTAIDVVVVRYHAEDGLYELTLPGAAASVEDWSDLEEGMIVEARVTGHNTGGLECEVNHIRGFIPISQIATYRVEQPEEFVGQKLACLVTEANPQRRNLVLSRRAILEREREEARQILMDSLEPGQVRDGVVRKIMEFGAFVDMGGVDGLLHISQLSWGRVNHPSEVLTEGQAIQVKIQKIEKETGRISLTYREMQTSPWADIEKKYPQHSVVHGKVVKLMEFGAFVQVEPGVEGLIHISELAPKRVWRVSDIVKEGDEVDVMVLSVDPTSQRMSLSMKALAAAPEPVKAEEPEAEPATAAQPRVQFKGPLKGGLGRSPGADRFGLKW